MLELKGKLDYFHSGGIFFRGICGEFTRDCFHPARRRRRVWPRMNAVKGGLDVVAVEEGIVLMRITGGILKGRHLATMRGAQIRPTSDMVREAIFDLIGQDVSGACVLDLFAGTGSLGIEALSRGAVRAIFIDRSVKALELIRRNLKACGMYEHARVLRKDLTGGLPKGYLWSKEKMDLVFVDPPYSKRLILPLLREVSVRGILSADCVVVAESAKDEILPEAVETLRLVKARVYGGTKINLFSPCEVDK